jgi:hypothetical protein
LKGGVPCDEGTAFAANEKECDVDGNDILIATYHQPSINLSSIFDSWHSFHTYEE